MKISGKTAEAIVTAGFLGRAPFAPGTAGTMGAAAIHLAIAYTIGTEKYFLLIPALALLATIGCIALGKWAEDFYGHTDPHPFVLDEVAGYFLAASFFPFAVQWQIAIAAFVLFRLFDIAKPFPVGWSQRFKAGVGIVADDLLAGAYSALGVFLIFRYIIK